MIHNQYIVKAISTQTTTNVITAKNFTLHTVVCPKALAGAVTFRDTGVPTTYFVLPAGSIGSFQFDASLPNGLDVVTASADTVIITTQTP